MTPSAAATSFKSFLTAQAAKDANETTAADQRKQALQEQTRSEAAALLDRIKASGVSTASLVLDGKTDSGTTAKDDSGKSDAAGAVSGTASSTAPASGAGMDIVTYAKVTKAYDSQKSSHAA